MQKRVIGDGRVSSKSFVNKRNSLEKTSLFNWPKSKRGQVTVFIILGIVLLIATALVIVLNTELISFGQEETFSTEKGKVENFVTACIQQVGEEALYLAGLQGGYIDLPERYTNDLNWHVPASDFLSVPLWAYGNEQDLPSLSQIKAEIDDYLEENVRNCLFETDVFSAEYDLIENSDVVADTEFQDSFTEFNVRWNLLIRDKSGETVAEIIEHTAESPVRFENMYNTAVAVLEAELSELKLEDITQDLIALEHEDVPVAGTDISCSVKQWSVAQAQKSLKEMLRINLRNLRVEGTSFTEYGDLFPYYQSHYQWNVEGVDNDASVVFRFDGENNPFTFQVTPRSGDRMYSNQMGGQDILKLVCLQTWKFTYDVVYPVTVQVTDTETGATLQYGVSVHLLKNFGDRGGEVYARESGLSSVNVDLEEYCYNNQYTIPMTVFTSSLVANNRTGVHITEPLEDVNISYTCIRYGCDMGATEYDFEQRGNAAGMTQLFPYCSGGIMRGEKEGYVEDWEYVPAEEGKEIHLNLRPLYSFELGKVKVIKHRLDVDNCKNDDVPDSNGLCTEIAEFEEEIDKGETALITLNLYDQDIDSGSSNDSEELALSFLGAFESRTAIHTEEFIVSPDLSEDDGSSDLLLSSLVSVLSEADFEYDVDVILTTNEDLVGGYDGTWVIDFDSISAEDAQVVFHVLELDPNDENYYLLLSSLDYYSRLISSPEIVIE